MITVYGIANCDKVKKARKWLSQHGVEHTFHDFRKDGLDESEVSRWCQQKGFTSILNTRSTTWRQLPDAQKEDLDEARAITLMTANPTLIKRPVISREALLITGYSEDEYKSVLL